MDYKKLKSTGIVVASMLMTTSLHDYNEFNALRDCDVKIAQSGHYDQLSNQKAVNRGHNSYTVTGKVKSKRDKRTHGFTCNIRHKEIVNWHVNGSHDGSHQKNSSSNNNTAVAVGAGVIALAVIAAASNQDNSNNNTNHARYNDYDTGGSAFDDMRYLKRQCRKNLRHHINRAHGRVEKLQLNTTHLHRKSLNGRGVVYFERGAIRDLDYNCVFDRRGLIRDGHYQFGNFR